MNFINQEEVKVCLNHCPAFRGLRHVLCLSALAVSYVWIIAPLLGGWDMFYSRDWYHSSCLNHCPAFRGLRHYYMQTYQAYNRSLNHCPAFRGLRRETSSPIAHAHYCLNHCPAFRGLRPFLINVMIASFTLGLNHCPAFRGLRLSFDIILNITILQSESLPRF